MLKKCYKSKRDYELQKGIENRIDSSYYNVIEIREGFVPEPVIETPVVVDPLAPDPDPPVDILIVDEKLIPEVKVTFFEPAFFSFTLYDISIETKPNELSYSALTLQFELWSASNNLYEHTDPNDLQHLIHFEIDPVYY